MLSAIRKQIQLSSSLNSLARKTMSVENKFSLKKKFHNNRQVPTLFKNSTTDDYVSFISNLISRLDQKAHW